MQTHNTVCSVELRSFSVERCTCIAIMFVQQYLPLAAVLILLSFISYCCEDIDNLASMKIEAIVGNFKVNQRNINHLINNRVQSTGNRSGGEAFAQNEEFAHLQLTPNQDLVSISYDRVNLLDDEGTKLCSKDGDFSTTFQVVMVMVPFVSADVNGQTTTDITYVTDVYTDSPDPILFDVFLGKATRVDTIDFTGDSIRMAKGNDSVIIQVDGIDECRQDAEMDEHFRKERDSKWSVFPSPVDCTLCEMKGRSNSFCRGIRETVCLHSTTRYDHCTNMRSSGKAHRCPVRVLITMATGKFQESFIMTDGGLPTLALESEKITDQGKLGLITSCFV